MACGHGAQEWECCRGRSSWERKGVQSLSKRILGATGKNRDLLHGEPGKVWCRRGRVASGLRESPSGWRLDGGELQWQPGQGTGRGLG